MTDSTLVVKLRAENARLIALLEAHGIEWQLPAEPVCLPVGNQSLTNLDTGSKLSLFRSLFKGRIDTYPLRWESRGGKSGYAPACANEWRPGICEKPRIKCSDCGQRQLLPVSDDVIYRRLAGAIVVGVYPLLSDDTCHFLAVDFDEADWREDALAFVQAARSLDVPVALEVSRSGNGLTHGFSSKTKCLRLMPAVWGLRSLAMLASAPGNCHSVRTTDFSRIRISCPRVGSVT